MFTQQQQKQLLQIAHQAIENGLQKGQPLSIELSDYEDALQEKYATFVTLNKNGDLRGCIGILEPLRPLVDDVAYNAYAAAFNDHRFSPVTQAEFEQLTIHISVLDTPTEMSFASEQDLINQMQPGVDGIILEDGGKRATFLPSVWESIKNRKEFLLHLKQKAGLPSNYWSDTIKIKRYGVESF